MAKIVVSYRRADTAAIAGRIFDRLSSHYGDDSVFMDVDNIPFGIDFRQHIKGVLETSDILVAVVGPHWAGGSGDRGRIQDAADPVRVEIETALARGMPVIPVLVDGARMPSPSDLPETLQPFAFINAAPVDIGRDFRQHMDRLIRGMDAIVAGNTLSTQAPGMVRSAAVPGGSRRSLTWLAVPLAIAIIAAGVWAFAPKSWFGGAAAPPAVSRANTTTFPEYKGRVHDEVGLLHPETQGQVTQKLAALESKTQVQVVAVTLSELPNLPPTEYGDELARRWNVGGDKRNGVLLVVYPTQRRLSFHVGSGVPPVLDRANTNLIVQNIDRRLQANDAVGGLMHAVDDIVELLTGDPKVWQARMSAAPTAPTPVPPPQPPPTTYRVLPNVSGGTQNLRSGPATKYPIVTAIPAGATGITISGCRASEDGTRPWCAANWRTFGGWISSCCIVDERTGAPPKTD